MDTAGVIRTILLVDIVTMTLLAVIYLGQRRMGWIAYCGWGLLALFVPVLGPFLVIANRPGQWDPNFSLTADAKRAFVFLHHQMGKQARLLQFKASRLQKKVRLNSGPPRLSLKPWLSTKLGIFDKPYQGKKLSRLDRARQRRQQNRDIGRDT
jgi:hypothetical protein